MKELKKRRGLIKLSKTFLDNDIELVRMLFSNFYPVSIVSDYLYMNDEIHYYGYSEHFEEVEEATIAPEYMVVVYSNKEGKTESIKFNRS